LGLVGACIAVLLPMRAAAGDMDPVLSRLVHPRGEAACASRESAFCTDNRAFEQLVSELGGGLAPPVDAGAATGGARSFYVALSSNVSTLRSGAGYWKLGTRGRDPSTAQNDSVASVLNWNRLDVRKGLPFGLEVGSSLGFGPGTSLWVLSVEVKLALFEGFHTGLGALPDVALHAATQQLVGSSELSLRTDAVDVRLSKPFVVRQEHVLTPLLALQLLFVNAKSSVIDATPGQSAFSACAPPSGQDNGVTLACSQPSGGAELNNNLTFRSVNQTRLRMFLGAEEHYRLLSIALSLGMDLTTPRLQSEATGDNLPREVLRQFSLHAACGLRY
jgi:hypothetical protein